MPTTPSSTNRRHHATSRTDTTSRAWLLPVVGVLVAVAVAVGIAVSVAAGPERLVSDSSLPNPMGGAAYAAPGEAVGTLELGGLTAAGSEVDMGKVPNGATFVPQWEFVNDTAETVVATVGQPQVLEGCCPGPVYVNGTIREPGDVMTLRPGARATVQFPLQMHPGMDGPHHLTVPFSVDDEVGEVHVTGIFGT